MQPRPDSPSTGTTASLAPAPACDVDDASTLTVSVTALCDFAARRGDLDLRFTPGPSAAQGIEGHVAVGRRRGEGYRREWRLEGVCEGLRVVGRADGFDPARSRLEEIKTHRGRVERIAAHHRERHWAQARCYAALACVSEGLEQIEVALVYFDVATRVETFESVEATAQSLWQALADLCRSYAAWARAEYAHRGARNAALRALPLPHASFRVGQRRLAEQAWHAARTQRCLLAQAPTGIGKTLGAIFPMLKAMPAEGFDKVVFLTAKNSGRAPAVATVDRLRARGARLRVVELVARDKACVHPDKACHGESCPLARGFFDRLPAARAQAVADASDHLDKVERDRATAHEAAPSAKAWSARLAEIAAAHSVCPYYLAQELVRWADVVVADYNQWFDRGGWLHAMAVEHGWKVALLVDEAHNLVERGREMYSATLRWGDWARARRVAPPNLRRPIDRVIRAWARVELPADGYAVGDLPDALVQALARSVPEWIDAWAEHAEAADPLLLECFGQALAFDALAAGFGDHALAETSVDTAVAVPRGRGSRAAAPPARAVGTVRPDIGIRNVVPAPYLSPRLDSASCAVVFSATLQPFDYYRDMLGLPVDAACLEVDSPFRAEQLEVRVAANLSTRWRDRSASIGPIVRLIGERFTQRAGNYLAFFGSYAYMREAAAAFALAWPKVPTWCQQPGMDEDERAAFLARFEDPRQDTAGVAFAVLGGVFAEGIDLPGERLVGAFVATLGMPQPTPANEAMRQRLDRLFGDGHAYVYLYPGMRRVSQAAGRVIRTPEDEGVVYLLDDRFTQPRVRRLLPTWWRPTSFSLEALEAASARAPTTGR